MSAPSPALIERNSAIVEAYRAGQSYGEIAARHSVTREAVRHVVRASGALRPAPKLARAPTHRAAWLTARDARNQARADGIVWMATALTGYSLAELRKRCNKREVSRVRQAVVYALRQNTGWSGFRITMFMHRGDPCLVYAAGDAVKYRCARDPVYAKLIEALLGAPPIGDIPELPAPQKPPPAPENCAISGETFRLDHNGQTDGELRTTLGMIDGSAGLAERLGVILKPVPQNRLWCAQCDCMVPVAKAEACQSLFCKAPV